MAILGEQPGLGRVGVGTELAAAIDEVPVGGVEGLGVNEGWWYVDEKRRARQLIPIIDEILLKV